MPRSESCGTLLYRRGPEEWEVLLVHPSGNYNRHAPWSIPKGVPDGNEDREAAARRETWEETGIQPEECIPLGYADYSTKRKRIWCFASPAPQGVEPRPASWEVDQACFLPLSAARRIIHPDQAVFLDRLLEYLERNSRA
ncbi:MAG: hydrolase [Gemmatales bacterium]|nr:MAG: hydrolase [Gemmatales bacterium]